MFSDETETKFIIYNSRKKEVASVDKTGNPNYIAGMMSRPGVTESQRAIYRLAIHLLEEKRRKNK